MNSYSLRALSILSTLVLTALSLPALAQTEVTEFVRGSDGRITLTWASKVGLEYRVETSEDLLNWSEQVSTVASGDSSTVILPNTGAARFLDRNLAEYGCGAKLLPHRVPVRVRA